jgi:hypothetical protein
MSISMAICETECRNALCRHQKKSVLRVLAEDAASYGDAAEYEVFLSVEDAAKIFPDWEGFAKRNRIKDDACTIYLDRLKDDADRATFEKVTKRTYTGWVDLSKVDEDMKKKLIAGSLPEDRQTEWEMISFEEMAAVCSECKLSWDKGRGCIGSFGPDNSALPEIAAKYGCEVTASVPGGVSSRRVYTGDDALLLSKEITVLRDALEKEGKLALKRYSGAVDRLEVVAKISVEEGCGFRFF